ncbi:phage baseplate protein, partial [Chromobacterium haemolyticum]|uniref:phage baseplate protein n=1 Tax=Chromobacterium haemolyticum TaxID=394935 RepID=UPI000687489E
FFWCTMDFLPAITGAISALVFGSKRSIAGIIPDVTFEEVHVDTMQITDHPVERGSLISDHAFAMPAEVVAKVAWSDNTNFLNGLLTGSLFRGVSSMQDLYQKLLELQQGTDPVIGPQPFDLSTGKRFYNNMLIKQLMVKTDIRSENILQVTIVFRQVRIVDTQTASLKAENQANPEKTAPVQNTGQRSPKPAS